MLVRLLSTTPFKTSIVRLSLVKVFPNDWRYVEHRNVTERNFLCYSCSTNQDIVTMVLECHSSDVQDLVDSHPPRVFLAQAWHNMTAPFRRVPLKLNLSAVKYVHQVLDGGVTTLLSILRERLAPKLFDDRDLQAVQRLTCPRPGGYDPNVSSTTFYFGTQADKHKNSD